MASRTSPATSHPDSDPGHLALAKSRLRDVLSHRVVATARILEHEICDPVGQPLEPRTLGTARKTLVRDGELVEIVRDNDPSWFHLPDTPPKDVQARLATLEPVLRELSRQAVSRRRGQCLELAIYRALGAQPDARYFGRFPDFDPSVSKRKNRYYKEEPPSYIGTAQYPGHVRSTSSICIAPRGSLVSRLKTSVSGFTPVETKSSGFSSSASRWIAFRSSSLAAYRALPSKSSASAA